LLTLSLSDHFIVFPAIPLCYLIKSQEMDTLSFLDKLVPVSFGEVYVAQACAPFS